MPGRIRAGETQRAGVARAVLAAAGLISGAGFLAYANGFHGPFLFDDLAHIVDNERIRHLMPLGHLLAGRRPVVDVTLAINYALGGLDDVRGYHAVNIIVHILAALTLYGLIRRSLLRLRRFQQRAPLAHRLAMATAVIWVVHPLLTQSVAYVIQRGESLMGLFYLLTLYCLNRSADSTNKIRWRGLAIAACVLGMGSKAVMVTAPLVAMLYDRAFLSSSFAETLRRRWGLYFGLMATWIVLWQSGVVAGVLDPDKTSATVGFGFTGIDPMTYALTQTNVVLRYLSLSVWPGALCFDYRFPPVNSLADVVAPISILIVLVALLVILIRRNPALAFVVAWFFLILLPTSSFIPIKDTFFEHRVYLSSAAIVLLAVLGGDRLLTYLGTRLSPRHAVPSWLAPVLVAAVALSLGFATHRRNRIYQSSVSMWRDVTLKQPKNARAFENLGTALAMQGRKREAAVEFARAVAADADFVSARANLGNALMETGKIQQALKQYREVLRVQPNNADIRVNLGHALRLLGHTEESLEAFRAASQVSPELTTPRTLAGAFFNLGSGLARQGKLDEAIATIRNAVRIWPDYEKGHYGLGRLLLVTGQVDEAVIHLRKALSINPGNREAQRALDEALSKRN